jgi:hypothetical protein
VYGCSGDNGVVNAVVNTAITTAEAADLAAVVPDV